MSKEELVKQYSEKWGVPPEEAEKKIESFLAKKPGRDESKDPFGLGDLFADPKSELAKKIIGVNQAAMSIAYTNKALKSMNTPPEEIEGLKEKVETIEKNVGGVLDFVNTTAKEMQAELKSRKEADERATLMGEIKGMLDPIREKVELLEKAKSGNGNVLEELTPESLVKASAEVTGRAKKFLEDRGFKIEVPEALTTEQVDKKIKDEVEKRKVEWEEKAGAEVEIEKERIRATETVLTSVVDRVFNVFLEPLKDEIHKAIKSGALSRGPR